MRKVLIGLISLMFVIGAIVLYSRLNITEPIVIDVPGNTDIFIEPDDINNIGKVEDVEIGPTTDVRYVNRNEQTQEIESEYGYETLLHQEDNIWEVRKPFRTIYEPNFTCYMTADTGSIEIETAANKTTFKDALFRGNVDIHIVPNENSNIQEAHIYLLDDVAFLSDLSQLSTQGPVTYDSNNAKMLGRGLELIYNSHLGRLEYFKINNLEKAIVKVPESSLIIDNQTSEKTTEKTVEKTTEETDIIETQQVTSHTLTPAEPESTTDIEETSKPLYYKCIFSKNVLIDSTIQQVYAKQDIVISNIIWNNSFGANEADSANETVINDFNEPNTAIVETVPEQPPPHVEKLIDVIITCDGGITLAPLDSVIEQQDLPEYISENTPNNIEFPEYDRDDQRTKLFSQNIKYNMNTGDAIADGPTQLIYVDANEADPNHTDSPISVYVQKGANYTKQLNRVVFTGDCLCNIPQDELSEPQIAILSSPVLTLDLPDQTNEETSTLPGITATGPAKLLFYVEDSNSNSQNSIKPFEITAQNQIEVVPEVNQIIFDGDCICIMGTEDLDEDRASTLKSPCITATLSITDSNQKFNITDLLAAGPVELDSYIEDSNESGHDLLKEPTQVHIVAQNDANFISSQKQVIFNGPCHTTMVQEDTNYIQELILKSDNLILDMFEEINDSQAVPFSGIEYMTANGPEVTLTIKKTGKETILTQTETSNGLLFGMTLICTGIEYDSKKHLFEAYGPGRIYLNNSEIDDSNSIDGIAPATEQWYAWIDNFHTLQYYTNTNKIIADPAQEESLYIQYTTIEDDQPGPIIQATAGRAEIDLIETIDGRTIFSRMIASGGIDYRDEEDNICIGDKMVYDRETSSIIFTGNETQDVYFNGMPVESIIYDLTSREVKTQSTGPGAFTLSP